LINNSSFDSKGNERTMGDQLDESTFITSLAGQQGEQQQVKRPVYEPEGLKRVKNLHGKVSHLVDNLAGKLGLVLRKQEKDFLAAYRAHMYNVQKELQGLRAKVDESELELRKNQKIVALQKERDWYRSEALRLDTFATNIKKDLKFMRERLSTIDEDRNWLERQLKASKKQNKLLRAELEIRLSATPATTISSLSGGGGGGGGQHSSGFLPPARSQTATPRGGEGSNRHQPPRSKSTVPGSKGSSSYRRRSNNGDKEATLLREEVDRLTSKLKNTEKKLIRARAEKVNRQRQKSAMEDLFLRCVDTVKSQIQRRMPRGGLTYGPNGEAALRATDGGHTTRPLGSPEERAEQSVALDQFTKVDRRQVVEELMMHDEVLAYLYDALFPRGDGDNEGGMMGGEEQRMMGDGSMMDDSQIMAEDEGKQNERSASGWRARLKQKSTGHAVRVPSLHRSDSQQSNMGEKIKLDPTVTEYLRQMSAGRDGL
jgi:hypothetical protein